MLHVVEHVDAWSLPPVFVSCCGRFSVLLFLCPLDTLMTSQVPFRQRPWPPSAQICTTWKHNRRAILAAANASATAPAGGAAPATAREQPAPSGRRKVCAVRAGQGRDGDGGVVKAVHYHSLNDSKVCSGGEDRSVGSYPDPPAGPKEQEGVRCVAWVCGKA